MLSFELLWVQQQLLAVKTHFGGDSVRKQRFSVRFVIFLSLTFPVALTGFVLLIPIRVLMSFLSVNATRTNIQVPVYLVHPAK